ncbi:TRAP-type uncharacterized transport system, fused permease component [Geomicrobium sp. JCM 19055]|nr:TRAP-type uncharacterized transport system, fused permease component [Geomicrobium sp. JCM 19055]
MLGIPLSTIGSLVIGFMIFGVILTHTGGGEFFFKLAQSIFGRSRGGEAKVSVAGSAFFGMLSGSAISNTVTTGQLTIPAMKKAGYEPEYAAAIEATSSTGGTITPPIMVQQYLLWRHLSVLRTLKSHLRRLSQPFCFSLLSFYKWMRMRQSVI